MTGSAQVRNIRDPSQPTANEHQEHMTTQRLHRTWCQVVCDGTWRDFAAQEIGCLKTIWEGGPMSCVNG